MVTGLDLVGELKDSNVMEKILKFLSEWQLEVVSTIELLATN